MSHCTTFAFSYTDEATIVAAFGRLGLVPVTGAVGEYSALSKALLARLGYAGGRQFRGIMARSGEYQMFVVREGEEYKLWIEKHGLNETDAPAVDELARRFRHAYLRSSLDGIVQSLDDAGVRHEIEETEGAITLFFGAGLERSLRITVTDDEVVEEEVSGVTGSACEILTSEVESLLSTAGAALQTTWKPEHSQTIEDQVIQVLRLA